MLHKLNVAPVRRSTAVLVTAMLLIASLLVFAPSPNATAAVTTTSIGHRDTTSVRGTVNRTYYQGPNVGSNSGSHWLTSGDYVEVVFDGHSLDLYGRLQSNYTTPARVYIDEQLVGTARYYATSTVASSKVFSISDLTDGRHTLRIEPDGWVAHTKIDAFTGVADAYDELSRAVDRYAALAPGDYTAASWAPFSTALTQATTAEATDTAAARRETARTGLEAAVASLVSTAGLRELTADLSTRNAGDYDPTAWAEFEQAAAGALSTANDADASAAEVVAAKNRVQEASAALIPVDGGQFVPIQNNEFWKDTDGNPIYSQGGGVFKYGDTYYWYGVKYDGAVAYYNSPTKTYTDKFRAITVYSSRDLANWTFENEIATADTKVWMPTATDVAGDYYSRIKTLDEASWLGRIGVSYNENTGKYVLFAQFKTPYDDPAADSSAGTLMLQGDSPVADFEYANFQPQIQGVVRQGTGDQTVFTDFDGTDYLVFSNRGGRANGYVSKISDADSLTVEPAANVWPANGGREGNAMFRLGDRYYMGASNLHGWDTSVTYLVDSTSIQSGYSAGYVLPGTEKDYSHVTQTGFFITVRGTTQDTVIYAGDRWAGFAWNGIGFNQWAPLSQTGDGVEFESLSNWEINAITGEWRVGQNNNYVLNPEFEADRVNVTTVTGWMNQVDPGSSVTSIVSNPSPGASPSQRTLRLGASAPFSGSVSQVNHAPDGVYRFAVKVNTVGGLDKARVVISSGADQSYTLDINAPTTGWQTFSVDDLKLTGDPVTVRVEAASATGGKHVLIDALSLIRQNVDKAALSEAIDEGAQRDAAAYARAGWERFATALAAAQQAGASETATQAQVDAATTALTEAASALTSAVTAVEATTSRTAYEVGDLWDPGTLGVTGSFADGTSRSLTADEYAVTGYDSTRAGTITLAVAVTASLRAVGAPAVADALTITVIVPVLEWNAQTAYNTGDRVTDDGALWQASWWTRNQKPGNPYGPWQEVSTAPDGTAIWTPSRIFGAGDTVIYNGVRYTAKWWTRNEAPGERYRSWQPAA